MSDQISYSELREHLKSHLDYVCDTNSVLRVTRRKGQEVVILSREDFDAMEETAYLLRSPANAKRLMRALSTPKKKRKAFASLDALKHDMGL